ncbi:hypothetical protein GCM10009741_44130 [Kribbella lupini]|uniref:Branched-subunit amino acid transport protein AzlD n=1 Tax=Kribbella lupini TaxID=291602 RepID=A0ABP4M4N1_9ACTN
MDRLLLLVVLARVAVLVLRAGRPRRVALLPGRLVLRLVGLGAGLRHPLLLAVGIGLGLGLMSPVRLPA